MYAPWWLYGRQGKGWAEKGLGFPAVITSSWAPAAACSAPSTGANLEWLTKGSYGATFKQDVRRTFGSFVYSPAAAR